MANGWNFSTRRPSDKVRDPIQGEFFAADAEEDSLEALVRESVQNSLDAAISAGSKPVRVRITVGEATAAEVAPFMDGVWTHVGAPGNGLRQPPAAHAKCKFITIEDFETRGLEGDEAATSQSSREPNGFFCFFRAEGVSEKQGDDRGRWGLGKTVFPRSSCINAFFGFTIRACDGKRLLMGNIALKTHTVSGKEWTPDGWFGSKRADDVVLPALEATVHDSFARVFQLGRTNEPGLSVVIPYVDTKVPSAELARMLEREVARSYFIPILANQLEVEVSHSGTCESVSAARIKQLCDSKEFPLGEICVVSLALAIGASAVHKVAIPRCSEDRHDWRSVELSDEIAKEVRDHLEAGKIVRFEVPVSLFPQSGATARQAFFLVDCRRDELVTKSVVRFVREGITVSGERKAPAQGCFVALVQVVAGDLAAALGDAENPAHTKWNANSNNERMKQRYKHAPALIDFVRHAPNELLKSIYQRASVDDDFVLADVFPADLLEEGRPAAPSGGRKKPKETAPLAPIPQPRPRLIRVEAGAAGEFAVLPGLGVLQDGKSHVVRVRVAYDRESGNPLEKWDPADFVLDYSKLSSRKGVRIIRCEANQLEFELQTRDFEVRVEGFDKRRDLYISTAVLGVTDDSAD